MYRDFPVSRPMLLCPFDEDSTEGRDMHCCLIPRTLFVPVGGRNEIPSSDSSSTSLGIETSRYIGYTDADLDMHVGSDGEITTILGRHSALYMRILARALSWLNDIVGGARSLTANYQTNETFDESFTCQSMLHQLLKLLS